MFVCPSCGLIGQAPGFCTEDGVSLVVADDPLLGQTVGSYRIVRLIGQGGMGVVYLAVQPNIGSRVAIKVLSQSASASVGMVDRFFAEARAANRIRHESIVNVLDLAVLPDQRPYIVMEHLEGAPLTTHLEAHRPFPLGFLVRVALETLSALDAAHSHGITHRDLKPDNLFVTTLGRVKVLDFGIAKLRPELGGQSDATRTGALLGTPQYMSPEQALGQTADPRADLYSLGVVLYEGAAGQRPFQAESLFELLRQHIESTPPPPSTLRPDLPPALERVILRAMAKDRNNRFQTATEMAEALTALLPALPDAGTTAPMPPRVSPLTPGHVAPTAAQTGVGSRTSVGGTSLAPAATRSSPWGFIVGILGALVALVAIGAAIVVYVIAERDAVNVSFDGTSASPSGALFADLDTARVAARKHFPDAELASISMTGMDREGKVTLSEPTHSIGFVFRSPAASKTSKTCLVSVSTTVYGTFAAPFEDGSYGCAQPTVRAPRCSVSAIMKRAPPGAKQLVFGHLPTPWTWSAIGGVPAVKSIPDDC